MFADKKDEIPSISTGGIVSSDKGGLEQAIGVLKNAFGAKKTLPIPETTPDIVLSGTPKKPDSGLPPAASPKPPKPVGSGTVLRK